MTSPAKTLFCVEPSPSQQALLKQIAQRHRLDFLACGGETNAIRHLEAGTAFAAMVVAHRLDDGDSFQIVETARLSPHHAALPIAFVMCDRNLALAQTAMNAGATEIFLRTKHEALFDFIGDCSCVSQEQHFGGKALLLEDSDSHACYVEKLCLALGMSVDCAKDVHSAERLFEQNAYQIVIVDVVLQDTKTGISFVKSIRQDAADAVRKQPMLVMSSFDDLPRRLQALKSGADDFISKPFTAEEFLWRIKKIMQTCASRDFNGKTAPADDKTPTTGLPLLLSPREREIFQMIVAGAGDREIAGELGISFWTVRSHVQQIFNKTGAINRRELMARFIPKKPFANE